MGNPANITLAAKPVLCSVCSARTIEPLACNRTPCAAGSNGGSAISKLISPACAQYLIDHKYTSPRHLTILGGSNGGLLMGAALTQRPDLFRAVISFVGIYDMLRGELDPNGAFNTTEYGTVKYPGQFKA